jgi:Tripartite ATP-independent periplasmic transporter, DctM component
MSNRPEFAIGTAHASSGDKIRLVSILRGPALRPDPHFAHRAYAAGMPISISLGLTVFTGTERFEIMALPFFILAGNFLTHGGVAGRMIDFATSVVGHWHGGLALAGIVPAMLPWTGGARAISHGHCAPASGHQGAGEGLGR